MDSGNDVPQPGEMVRTELKRRGWTQDDLARILGKPTPRINELIQGKLAVSPDIAAALAAAFSTAPEYWLHAEAAYRLALASPHTGEVRRRARLYETAPVKELRKRRWIRDTDDTDATERDLISLFGVSSIGEDPAIFGAMRKPLPNAALTPGQLAWACRVRQIAAAIPASAIGTFDPDRLDACRNDLRKLAAYSGEVRKAPALLMSYGIRFVVVEGLSGAKVDGFATWLDQQSPVIGMSLRYDRLDSFWFTLGHEVAHIRHQDVAPVDGDVVGLDDLPLEVKPLMERRADEESAAMFVPPNELKSFIQRVGPLYSTEKINQFANRVKMHPSLIIGQLKHLGEIKYSAHNKTVVPVRDTVVKAALTDGWGQFINPGVGS